MNLFSREQTVGIFRGFSEGGLEFHADLVLPYQNNFQSAPMHGQFLAVQLETEEEGVLGRITSISAQGRLTSTAGEDFNIRAVSEERPIPEDLREQYLRYRVDMRVLGLLRIVDGTLVFIASHRRLPHVGSKVAFLCPDTLREVAGHNENGAELGFLALGEFIYAGDDKRLHREPWMQVKSPGITPRFDVRNLVARRSFVFARAGFGKSNLVKLLFSHLYEEIPTVQKRAGLSVPVGTVIFDPDGEYYWPDDKGRPGLCDVPALEDKVVVFTKKQGPSAFYQSFVAGDIKLDIRRLRPSDVISIALPPEKQDQQNVRKLKGLSDESWRHLVDEIYQNRNAADENILRRLLQLNQTQDAELFAARSNMTAIVAMLHDPNSQMMDMLIQSLRAGRICIVDVSQMRGNPALILSGLILRRIFDHNQDEFTKAEPRTIPTIAVVEEAQSVLGSTGSSGEGPYVAWVKEGRKYDLGALLITQQPGSITSEILSQGDNWFIFHLLSALDLQAVKRANAHFSDDILSALLNEPIPGHGAFWSSAAGRSYPIPLRVLSFESTFKVRDPGYTMDAGNTFARELRKRFSEAINASAEQVSVPRPADETPGSAEAEGADTPVDVLATYTQSAIARLRDDAQYLDRMRKQGVPWFDVQQRIMGFLPDFLDNRDDEAYRIVPRAMNDIFGDQGWETERREKKTGRGQTTWIVVK